MPTVDRDDDLHPPIDAAAELSRRARTRMRAMEIEVGLLSRRTKIELRRLRRLINQPDLYKLGPTLLEVERIARVLRVRPEWLAGWVEGEG